MRKENKSDIEIGKKGRTFFCDQYYGCGWETAHSEDDRRIKYGD